MPPKKKIKLDDTLDNYYEDDFEYGILTEGTLTVNEVTVIETVNYQWKVTYKIVREQDSKKVEVLVDFDSRYVFEDEVTMYIIVEADGEKLEEQFELEKRIGQKFEVALDQIDSKIEDKNIKVTCEISVSCAEYNAKNIGTTAASTVQNRPHDAILLIGNEKFYVLKQYLATWSKYFNTLFFGDNVKEDKKEFTIEDVNAIEFGVLMHIIHPSLIVSINDVNVLFLLKLAACFEMPSVVAMCGTYLSDFDNAPDVTLMHLLELADQHKMSHLQVAVLKSIHGMDPVKHKEFFDENRDRIKNLSYGTLNNLT